MTRLCGLVIAFACSFSALTLAQGVQTGTLTGTVTDQAGLVVPGVSVTVTSSALQGARVVVTDANGVYTIPGLAPGEYTVRFELMGLRTVEATQRVDLGLTARVDARMQVAAVTEQVQVTAELPGLLSTTQGGANFRTEELDSLATSRTVQGIAELAPGLTDNAPNGGQVTIGGGFAFDNQFLVDGVDIADNLFGNPNNLFIEAAIEEVQVLTSGISAEFGRFGGGVVNAITRSGGNEFDGTFRVNFYSPSWTRRTAFEVEQDQVRDSDLQQNYEGTAGGPIVRDRLWFFLAGRRQASDTPFTLPETGINIERSNENTRWETKLTGTLANVHTVQGSYLRNSTEQVQEALTGLSIDPRTVTNRSLPNDLWVVSYRGVVANDLFAQLQVSRREFGFRNAGGTETALERSPFRSRGVAPGVPVNRFYNAPFFDATDPEDRNNRQIAGSVNWFLTPGRGGTHNLKIGYENFETTNTGGNSQSATGYVFRADYVMAGGQPARNADGHPIPMFVPGTTRLENWLATRNATLDIQTNSFYVHDQWTAGPRWTFDLGARLEVVRSEATGDINSVDTTNIVPRLGASYDITGEGRWIAQATYGHYAGKYSEAQFSSNTDVANPSLVVHQYSGPAGQGYDFAPGFDLNNYTTIIGGSFPTANIFFEDGLESPLTKEFTLALGAPVADRGAVKVSYQWRTMSSFIEDFIDDPSPEGRTTVVRDGVDFGTFDNIEFRNTDDPVRDYQALVFQGDYRLGDRWRADAHWTVQLRNHGNYEGEATNQPGVPSVFGDYPEIISLGRNFPEGRLDDFQRHKVRAWTTYSLGAGRFGVVDLGLLYRFNSPLTYSFAASGVPLSEVQLARNPGYVDLPGFGSQTLFFGERGEGEFESSSIFDMAVTYSVPVWQELGPWVKLELYNVFNDQSLTGFDTTVSPNPDSPLDADGLPTGYIRGPNFGEPTAASDFPRSATTFSGQNLFARTFFVSAGFRF